jgi:hypothetical protein
MDLSEREPSDRSQEGETSRTLHRDRHSRLSVISKGQSISTIELVVDMFSQCPRVDLETIFWKLMLLNDLHDRGYELACDHDSFICAEREMSVDGLEDEIRTLLEMISKLDVS